MTVSTTASTEGASASVPIVPPATLGMFGGGQLGRYALMAARTMGYRTIVVDPDPNAPAGAVADEHLVASYDDVDALAVLQSRCDVVTTEFENPPAQALDALSDSIRVAPSSFAVGVAQDRIAEKRFLTDHGFPVGAHCVLVDAEDLDDVTAALVDAGAVIKTARLGYDGKGQRRVAGRDEVTRAWAELGHVPCVVEALLDLDTEISVLVARTADGVHKVWPIAENEHVDGILDVSTVPAAIDERLRDEATTLALAIADALEYVGVLAIEMFVVGGEPLVNELAPRPHNSGHWTLDASVTSQYEQQVRAACGVGLGDTSLSCGGVAMVNLLGDIWFDDTGRREPNWSAVLADPMAKLHLYGKTEPRPARKMGHLTVLAAKPAEARSHAIDLRARL